jgi:hypothetical protein
VAELENIIEGMQNLFFELRESSGERVRKLESHNERESFDETLKSLTERFVALAKMAETVQSPGEEDITDSRSQGGRSDRQGSKDKEGPTSGSSDGGLPTWGGYQISYARDGPHEDTHSSTHNSSTSRGTYDIARQAQRTSSNLLDQQNVNSLSQPFPELTPPISYSFQEATFARRLHRSCLEKAYSLLTSPSANESEVARIFAYTFCYASREDVASSLRSLLKASASESLVGEDYPELPIHDVLDGTNEETFNRSLEGFKQLVRLGIVGKFLKPSDVEQILVDKGVLQTIDTSDSEHGSSPASSQDFGYLPSSSASVDSSTDAESLFPGGGPQAKTVEIEETLRGRPIIEGVKSTVDLDLLVKGGALGTSYRRY